MTHCYILPTQVAGPPQYFLLDHLPLSALFSLGTSHGCILGQVFFSHSVFSLLVVSSIFIVLTIINILLSYILDPEL